MKKRLSVVCSMIISASLLLGNSGVCANRTVLTSSVQEVDEVEYDIEMWEENGNIEYPVTEDSDEWSSFETHDEMVAACNVPEELLEEASTEELVSLMLDYPLLGDLGMYSDLNEGFYFLSQNSNVLAEIMKREDGAQALLKAYADLEFIKDNSEINNILEEANDDSNVNLDVLNEEEYSDTIEEISDSIIEDTFLEVALGQEDIIDDLDKSDMAMLSDVAKEKVEEKIDSNVYSACATTIYEIAEENDCIDNFDEVVEVDNDDTSDKVIGNSYETTVRTPKGSKVAVTAYDYYGVANALSDTEHVKKRYPKAKIIGPATNQYNCHSYAWYKKSKSNVYWMNNPAKYMTDGSYEEVGTTPTAKKQRVCYTLYGLKNPYVHSGVVYRINGSTIKLKSKWGACPLVIHKVGYSPYSGTPIYYKKK